MRVEVVRSARRRKTVEARQVGEVLRICIPASMSATEEAHWVTEMTRRIGRRSRAGQVDLPARAADLARRFGLPRPAAIRWVGNQAWRWGSCTPSNGTIRISDRLAREPGWVLDYVIVHELAHLAVGPHNRAFWALVERYPLAERARGFLMARGTDGDERIAQPEDPEQDATDRDQESPLATPTRRASPGTAAAGGNPAPVTAVRPSW